MYAWKLQVWLGECMHSLCIIQNRLKWPWRRKKCLNYWTHWSSLCLATQTGPGRVTPPFILSTKRERKIERELPSATSENRILFFWSEKTNTLFMKRNEKRQNLQYKQHIWSKERWSSFTHFCGLWRKFRVKLRAVILMKIVAKTFYWLKMISTIVNWPSSHGRFKLWD